ncbi:MAG TPA: rhomboid family intramembrane serine protease [Planctomycetota bacterium]
MPDSPTREELLARARRRDLDRDYKGALEDYGALVALDPGNPDHLLERGRLRSILHDYPGARADFLAAAPAKPGDPKTLYYLAYSRAHISPAEAMEDYREAAKAEPKDAAGFYYRGLTRLALSESGKAHADFAEAARLAPEEDPHRDLYQDKASETEPFSLSRSIRGAPVTWALAAVNIAIMIAFRELLSNPSVEQLMRRGAVERYAVHSGEVWRLLTSVFLHIGAGHLIWNTWGGIVLCSPVEKALGPWRFLAVYLACGVAASAVSVLGHHVVAAGSSGALFGINGILLLLLWRQRRKWQANRRVRRMLWSMGVWFVVGLVAPFDNWAHAGGLVFGLLFGKLLLPSAGPPAPARKAAWSLVALLWLGVTVAAVFGRFDPLYRRATALSQEVEAARARGDFAGAETLLTRALGTGLDDEWIRLARGSSRQARGDLDGAREDFVALVNRKEDVNGLWGLGSIAAARGQHEDALSFYDRALRVQADHPDLLVNRGYSLRALNRSKEGGRDVRRALELAPADWPHRASALELLKELER